MTTPPDPDGGWSATIRPIRNAVVVPPLSSGFVQAAGVLYADGSHCPQGALWRRHRALTTAPPSLTEVTETVPGRWLWGGVLWSHFGHFLAESTARLWALDHLDEPVDGVLFIPKRPRNGERLKGFHRPFFDLMGIDIPVRIATAPLAVETLLVPGQGFGLGAISAGTEQVRDQFATRFARNVAPDGPDRLYVSRSALGFDRGSVLGETALEDNMRAEGYTIFHPQEHPMAVQVARYRAARQVVATDGSALHLLAFAMPRDQSVAIIARRRSTAVDLLARHVSAFTGRAPLLVTAIRRSWFPDGRKSLRRLALGELDLAEAGRKLEETGFVSAGRWQNLSQTEAERHLARTGRNWHLKRWMRRRKRAGTGA